MRADPWAAGRRDGASKRMTPELAERLIDSLNEGLAGVEEIVVHLYGGEPLGNLSAVEALVERARRYTTGRFRFAITTNGTIRSDEAIELLERGAFDIVLSIDGPAGKPTHAQVIEFLSAVRGRTQCRVRGSAVVRSGAPLKAAVDYLSSLPLDAIKAQAVRAPEGDPSALTDEERNEYMRDLDAIGDRVIADLEAGRQPLDDRFSARVLQMLAGGVRER